MLPAIAAAFHAVAAALPGAVPAIVSAVPFAAAAGLHLVAVAVHTPGPETHTLKGSPDVVAECIERNARAEQTGIAAVSQPLYGAATYGVVLKRGGPTGDPFMSGMIQITPAGSSTAEFRPLAEGDLQTELVARLLAGC